MTFYDFIYNRLVFTLNRFVNDTCDIEYGADIFYFASGSGNDFIRDLGKEKGTEPFCINEYLKDLPVATVKGKDYRFINGVGYGIDGYCCVVGDELRGKTDKPINYSAIAVKGLLFHYHPTNAVVTVDGKKYEYKKVWIAPTMNGRFYGGGIMPTTHQDRLNKERSVSLMVLYGTGKLKTLVRFPKLFADGHNEKYKDMEAIHSGYDITVSFDRPTPLQIDGELIEDVTEYRVRSSALLKEAAKEKEAAAVK